MSDLQRAPLAEFVGSGELDALSRQAASLPRLRLNRNFHRSDEALCQRLLNAIEPGSYIRPHRHVEEGKEETLVVIRGRMGLVLFDAEGAVRQAVALGPDEESMLVHIPLGTFHTWISLQSGSVFFEAKAGPYRPLGPREVASWAPAEGDPKAAEFLASLSRLFVMEGA